MVRPRKSGFVEEDDSESSSRSKSKFVFSDSDDDAEANEDLSLKIVQKAISRSSSHKEGKDDDAVRDSRGGSGGGLGDDIVMTELVALDGVKKKMKKEKKKKKLKKIETGAQTCQVISAPLPEGQNTEVIEDLNVVKLSEEGGVDNNNNAVLRRLLRGPRYFDPPNSGWGTCYSCGEEGHSAVNCKSAKRKKPCFVCGSFEHGARNCQKGKDCFICNKSGHRAKDCPEKFKRCSYRSDLCLRCGSSGHDMSACNNNYPPDDLKEIQCYVCKSFGHLCCANYFGTTQAEMSCYKCGRLGHAGLSCRASHGGETAGEGTPASCFKCGQEGHFARECMTPYKASRTSEGTLSSCFKCGKEGHFARECASSVKDKKQSRELSTPKKKASKENKGSYKGHRSAPQNLGRGHKKKRLQFDDKTPSSKRRAYGGWIVDDSVDFPRGNGVANSGWQSRPSTNYRDYQTSNSSSVRHPSAPSPVRYGSPYPRTPSSQSSRNSYQDGFSASLSRFRGPDSGSRSNNSHKYF